MNGFNRVVLMGNLTKDPELRHIPSGTAVAELGLAANEAFKNQSGQVVQKTCFVDFVVWGRQAETCCQYLKKGAPVLLEGRLQLDQWQTQDGQNRSRLRVRADRVQFLSGGQRQQDTAGPAGKAPPAKEDPGAPLQDIPF